MADRERKREEVARAVAGVLKPDEPRIEVWDAFDEHDHPREYRVADGLIELADALGIVAKVPANYRIVPDA